LNKFDDYVDCGKQLQAHVLANWSTKAWMDIWKWYKIETMTNSK